MSTPLTPYPDLSERPHSLEIQQRMNASPEALYVAWTEKFEEWFAAPGSVQMRAEIGSVFFFETVFKFEGKDALRRHPHYGRFLKLLKNRSIEMTWVTGKGGTEGAETLLSIELEPQGSGGTLLTLSHAGFYTESARDTHKNAWYFVLEKLDGKLTLN